MSYDLRLVIDTGGPEPAEVADLGNYTSNCGPMFRLALPGDDGIPGLNGLTGEEAAGSLWVAVEKMGADMETYRAMNPPNGWGNADRARDWMAQMISDCQRHPRATVEVCW